MSCLHFVFTLLTVACLQLLLLPDAVQAQDQEHKSLNERAAELIDEKIQYYVAHADEQASNKELTAKLAELHTFVNESVGVAYKIKFFYEFIAFDNERIALETQIVELVSKLNERDAVKNAELVEKLRKSVNESNQQKSQALLEATQQLASERGFESFAKNTTITARQRKFVENSALERRVKKILRKFGIIGQSARGIVDTLLNDNNQLKRLKKKLDELDDDDDKCSFWDIFDLFF